MVCLEKFKLEFLALSGMGGIGLVLRCIGMNYQVWFSRINLN